MAFQHFILVATVLLCNRVSGLKCPLLVNRTSPGVTEKNFLGIWYPQYLITNYEPSAEDIGRFACTKFSAEKSNKSNNFEMKLKRFDPRFKDDDKLNVFSNLHPAIPDEFGGFWLGVQNINGRDMWTTIMQILDIFDRDRYMLILSCSVIRSYNKFNGFVLNREQQMWYKYNANEYLYANIALDRSLERYLYSLSPRPWRKNYFRFVQLTQNVEICTQFDLVHSGARNFLFKSHVYFNLSILFVSLLVIQKC